MVLAARSPMPSPTRGEGTNARAAFAAAAVSMLVALPECRRLRGRGFLLVLRLPFVVRHAVHALAALVLAQRHALGVGRILHPVRQAVAAEAGEIHQVDVLHVGART